VTALFPRPVIRKRPDGRKEVDGYLDLGYKGPDRPSGIVLEDRADADERFLLSYSSGLALVAVPAYIRSEPSEPILDSPLGQVRLYVEDGELELELTGSEGLFTEPVYTRNTADLAVYRVTAEALATLDPAELTTTEYA
jgi:hypothetical protein